VSAPAFEGERFEGEPFKGLAPGAVLGILGGGQLARMIALAAADLGIRCHILAPEPDNPAFDVAAAYTVAAYEDEAALAGFADAVDVVTYEFENVPAATAAFLAARKPLHPGARALAVTQDRLSEKNFVADLGLAVAPFRSVDSLADLEAAVAALGRPCVLKTRRFGYDGKGQVKILPDTDLTLAYEAISRSPAVLEGFVSFSREVSVVAARGTGGAFAAFDLCENEHRDHILAFTRIPARVSSATEASAIEAARRIGAALGYVGVFAVEMFVVGEGASEAVVVNEIAPRVHNSGHWTSEGAQTSQFHQHVRAVCGFPLGCAQRRGRVEMENLVGDAALRWRDLLAEPGAHLHLYGKRSARPGRKMGHVTRVFPEQG
jgi:5-(carboxyamino)imidazole ribonucleotide synthase